MKVALNPELERRIHRHGSKVEVLAPSTLRDHFIEYAREQQAMYLACARGVWRFLPLR